MTGKDYYKPVSMYGYPALSVRKVNGIVMFSGVVQSSGTVKANSSMGIMIPTGYRPTVRTPVWDSRRSVGSGSESVVETTGEVIWGPAVDAQAACVFSASWPAD
jgi:hypothetical protein